MVDWYVFFAAALAFLDRPLGWVFLTLSFNLFVSVQLVLSLSRRSADYVDILPAALWRRFLAMLIDILLLCSAVYWVFQANVIPREFLALANVALFPILLVASLPVLVAVNAVFAFFISGTRRGTPGMIVMRIRIVDVDGSTLTFRKAFLRNIALAFNLYLFGFGILSAMFSKWNQTLHDQMVGTLVVRA